MKSRPYYYKLNGHTPVPCEIEELEPLFKDIARRRVAIDDIEINGIPYQVSTVFLAIDHAFGGGPPILFETMIFGGNREDIYMKRYCTWDEAEDGHQEALEYLKGLMELERLALLEDKRK